MHGQSASSNASAAEERELVVSRLQNYRVRDIHRWVGLHVTITAIGIWGRVWIASICDARSATTGVPDVAHVVASGRGAVLVDVNTVLLVICDLTGSNSAVCNDALDRHRL